jgi:polar amino acid transport system permease protein
MDFQAFIVRWDKFWEKAIQPAFYDRILLGLKNTFLIALIGFSLGFLIGTILAVFKLLPKNSKIGKFLSAISDVYVAIFRGTPMVVQLLVAYYVLLPILGIKATGLTVCEVMFGLNSAAYVCEIMRSGILSVDHGQMEAGRSIGLTYMQTMFRIVFPQAIKNILPTLGNELITLIKETSVASFVGATDLFSAFQYIGSNNYEYMIPYLMMAVIYIVIIVILTLLLKLLERRLRASDRR